MQNLFSNANQTSTLRSLLTCCAILISVANNIAQDISSPTNDGKKNLSSTNIETNNDGKVFLQSENGVAKRLIINGKEIPQSEFANYHDLINRLLIQAEKDRIQGEKDRLQGEKDRAQGELDRIQGEKDRAQGDKDRMNAQKDQEQAQKDRQQALKDKEQALKDRQQAQKDRIQAQKDREQAKKDRILAAQFNTEVRSELIKDGIVKTEDPLSFHLRGGGVFEVNGIAQSPEAFQKYKAIFERIFGYPLQRGVTVSEYGNTWER